MRKTETSRLTVWGSSRAAKRALQLSAVALGIGLLMASGAARAGDDDDEDDKTFEEKIIEGLMKGIGGANMEKSGIDHRERAPPLGAPKADPPPPAAPAAGGDAPHRPE